MSKNNFLLIDLQEAKTKKLAETITSDTSRKILNHLAETEDTEANISKQLDIPISTVHYHLQKLKQAGLVVVKEFHYSSKGREVDHYQLANKYIIIAPRKVNGLKEKLKGILPVAVIFAGISFLINYLEKFPDAQPLAREAASESLTMDMAVAPQLAEPSIAFWFFIGSVLALLLYLIVEFVRETFLKSA